MEYIIISWTRFIIKHLEEIAQFEDPDTCQNSHKNIDIWGLRRNKGVMEIN